MGVFDFLRISVAQAKPAPVAKAGKNTVEVDGKRFPIAAITDKGFVADRFDGSLIKGQNARLTISIDDAIARLSFATTVLVTEVKDGRLVAAWNLITPELEETLKKYSQRKKKTSSR